MGVRFPQGGCKHPKKPLIGLFSLFWPKFAPKTENLILKNGKIEELRKFILQPGDLSEFYTFKSENQYKFTEINLQAKNLSDSPCSLFDATIIKAVIDGSEDIYIDPVWIELVFDKRRE